MVRVLLFLFIVILTLPGEAQDDDLYFSEALSMYLPKYVSKAQEAYLDDNVQRANFLFDSLVNNCLKGSYLDNFKVKNLKNKVIPLEKLDKPTYLITNASWIVPTKGEIPALNALAEKYQDKIDFVVIFWDKRKTARDLAKQYHKSVKVYFVDELSNESNYVIRNLKHSLGVPTSFLLTEEKKIVDIKRSITHPYAVAKNESFELNHKAFSEGISQLLLQDSSELSEHSAETRLP
ncbi:TlpA family protein disulfide reductase [Salinimicrobium sp. GXAS 041]|uniref:TlpA family protein disulfide reductase n=1 Tax=Salinimicrobium sp. GXAS 041 TaxID=3400806 RepID=UPI003C7366A2